MLSIREIGAAGSRAGDSTAEAELARSEALIDELEPRIEAFAAGPADARRGLRPARRHRLRRQGHHRHRRPADADGLGDL